MAHKSLASSLLKGLALTLGGGVALGVGIKIGQGGVGPETFEGEATGGVALEPVLERLVGIENRVGQVELVLSEGTLSGAGVAESIRSERPRDTSGATSGEPLHHALEQFETRLISQDSEMAAIRTDLRALDDRSSERMSHFGATIDQLQSRLPGLVEETVGTCFQKMETKLHQEIEQTHTRTLETFVDNIQTKVVQRISLFEQDLAGQAEAMNQLREYSQKTDQNMQRLLVGVDRLASEIARKAEIHVAPAANVPGPDPRPPHAAARELHGSESTNSPPPVSPPVEFPAPPVSTGPVPPPANTADLKPKGTHAESATDTKVVRDSAGDTTTDPPKDPASRNVSRSRSGPLEEPSPAEFPKPLLPGNPGYIPNSFLEPEGDATTSRAKWLIPAVSAGIVATVALLGWQSGVLSQSDTKPKPAKSGNQARLNDTAATTPRVETANGAKVAPDVAPAGAVAAGTADTEPSRIEAARAFAQHREYPKAEEVYRSILKTDPQNREVILALADVLFREEKFEESAAYLKSLTSRPRP